MNMAITYFIALLKHRATSCCCTYGVKNLKERRVSQDANTIHSLQSLEIRANRIYRKMCVSCLCIMGVRHINQDQLAKRWDLSPRTLERWRWKG